jgi:hypothetical protein
LELLGNFWPGFVGAMALLSRPLSAAVRKSLRSVEAMGMETFKATYPGETTKFWVGWQEFSRVAQFILASRDEYLDWIKMRCWNDQVSVFLLP